MSTVDIALRLSGHLPPSQELNYCLGLSPTWTARKGEQIAKRRVQPIDVWLLNLVKYESDRPEMVINQYWLQVSALITKLAPALASLDRTQCKADLFVSTIVNEDQGGLSLPPGLISAAAAANLSLQLSILVMPDSDEGSELLTSETAEPSHESSISVE
ncbi:MAG: hypothetical protein H7Z11_11720 [Verrucomicrobia bacterium]|nr:hypothetical protein [Leptolyngbya sp. ES-bin-22]